MPGIANQVACGMSRWPLLVNALLESGLQVERVEEPGPEEAPKWANNDSRNKLIGYGVRHVLYLARSGNHRDWPSYRLTRATRGRGTDTRPAGSFWSRPSRSATRRGFSPSVGNQRVPSSARVTASSRLAF